MLDPKYGMLVEDASGEVFKVMTPMRTRHKLVAVVVCRADRKTGRVIDMPTTLGLSDWEDMKDYPIS